MHECEPAPQASGSRSYRPRNVRANSLYQCAVRHAPELKAGSRFMRRVEQNVIERFLECGDPHHGFARLRCGDCGHGCILAFSCKARYFCPSCHKTLKRNFQVMPGADWLALLCRPIPDRFEHLVRYAGWYSNRARGKRRRMGADALGVAVQEADAPTAARVRSTWARLIHKVYEVDPLECPKCKGPMRVISLIEDSEVIRRILRHLGLWAPQQPPQRLHGPPAPDLPGSSLNVLTYHPVPDIA